MKINIYGLACYTAGMLMGLGLPQPFIAHIAMGMLIAFGAIILSDRT
jgi:hypothetical protein